MRALSALLLMLMLPGLLLPAGVVLHVCLCAWAASDAPTCCAAHGDVTPRSCCVHHRARAAKQDTEQGGERTDARGNCHCVSVQAPDDRPLPAPVPPVAMHVAAPPPAGAIAIAPPVAQHELRTFPLPHCRPPPPGRHRNLPLRL
jgi:hypothetical protein